MKIVSLCLLVLCTSLTTVMAHSVTLPASIYSSTDQVQNVVTTGLSTAEGPSWDPVGNALYFTDYTVNAIFKVPGGSGTATKYKQGLNIVCGTAIDAQNRLIFGERSKMSAVQLSTGVVTVLTDSAHGIAAGRTVNDLTLASDGGIFFSHNEWSSECYVYYLPPNGTAQKKLTFPNGQFPNGLEYFEKKNILFVNLSQVNKVVKYSVDTQKNLTNQTNFATVNGPDGITFDENGNVYVAEGGTSSIDVFDSTGTKLGSITINTGGATNCTFGGSDNQTLFITSGAGVYSVHLKVKGYNPFSTPIANVVKGNASQTAKTISASKRTVSVKGISGNTATSKCEFSVLGRSVSKNSQAGLTASGLYFGTQKK